MQSKNDDNGIGMAIDLGSPVPGCARVGGVAMLGIATLVVKQMYSWPVSVLTSPTYLGHSEKQN